MAERIMQLGGVSIAMGADAAEETEIPRPPRDREAPVAKFDRLLLAHEIVLSFARQAARRGSEQGGPCSLHNPVIAQQLYRVFDAAILDLDGSLALSATCKSTTVAQVTKQLLAAADTGEREPGRLKLLALEGIERSASH